MRHVDFEHCTRFVYDYLRRRRSTAQQAHARLHAFERKHVGIRTLENSCRLDHRFDGISDRVTPAHRTRARQLHHDDVAVTVDHHARQPVRLRVHQTHRFTLRKQLAAQRDRAPDAVPEKRGVDFPLLPSPHARDDLRLRVAGGHRQEFPVGAVDLDGVARFRRAGEFRDRARKHPRMAALERFLAAGLEDELIHATADERR
jgi:hypothetical protein